MCVLYRRWTRAFRQATFTQLTQTQREQLTSFRNKATGRFTVAVGALLLAAGETWQIIEHHRWPTWLFGLHAGVDTSVIALWLDREQADTTQIYLVDLALKEKALARTRPPDTTPGRYKPPDQFLAFPRSPLITPTFPRRVMPPPAAPAAWSA
jgi:hypothetical protein